MTKKIIRYVLIAIGLYVLYFAIGMVLTKTGVVDKWTIAPNAALQSSDKSRDVSTKDSDGPHIFYGHGHIVVKSVRGSDSTAVAVADTFASDNRASILVSCAFSQHPDWNFSTHLKNTLLNEPAESAADSIAIISDIEGNFEAFRNLLVANNVMSRDYKWVFGSGHLVLLGDFFDRGLHVTECLWLIYHLEQEAERAGGKVHFILGNHDIMNMGGDYRYVRKKYIENAVLIGENYRDWYTPNTELGRWLQTKNIVEKVGPVLFVHGGISKDVNHLSMSLARINELARTQYFFESSVHSDALPEPLKTLFSSKKSPFWYRGYVHDEASEKQVKKTLSLYNATAIVVGHTVVDDITSLYGGRVIAIDTRHAEGNSHALMYKAGKFYAIDQSGKRKPL